VGCLNCTKAGGFGSPQGEKRKTHLCGKRPPPKTIMNPSNRQKTRGVSNRLGLTDVSIPLALVGALWFGEPKILAGDGHNTVYCIPCWHRKKVTCSFIKILKGICN